MFLHMFFHRSEKKKPCTRGGWEKVFMLPFNPFQTIVPIKRIIWNKIYDHLKWLGKMEMITREKSMSSVQQVGKILHFLFFFATTKFITLRQFSSAQKMIISHWKFKIRCILLFLHKRNSFSDDAKRINARNGNGVSFCILKLMTWAQQ